MKYFKLDSQNSEILRILFYGLCLDTEPEPFKKPYLRFNRKFENYKKLKI